jgi:hypothetical protein
MHRDGAIGAAGAAAIALANHLHLRKQIAALNGGPVASVLADRSVTKTGVRLALLQAGALG